ncbi:MAG: hypothetical protein H8E66_04720 [Planctomycetes bacterium]|nr:hypothetical protein [Planctomycetota bacterium]
MSQGPIISVTAPSRLHFGLLSFGNPNVRQFGGIGVMLDRPGVKLRIQPANSFEIVGLMRDRIRDAALRWERCSKDVSELRCKIELVSAPRLHAGLGVGTQLALAVATGLNELHGRPTPPVAELANSVGRGLRSAVGTYGFVSGGLIAEQGKLQNDSVSPLLERVALPDPWRFVLVSPRSGVGLHGKAEQATFDELPPVPTQVTERLTEIMIKRILPAAKLADFLEFSEAVYDFGFLSGSCFESVQGGSYNGRELESLVNRIRDGGVRGVGQSSWGPTIFSVCESDASANALAESLCSQDEGGEYELVISAPNNRGARVTTESPVR